MRNSLASYKESLSRIAHEVLEVAKEEAMENGSASTCLNSQQSSRSIPPQQSSLANGIDHGCNDEIAKYRADIQKLQASESEIKALSFSYAALLKEKEEQLHDLRQEYVLLQKNLETRKVDGSILGDESRRTLSNDYVTPKRSLDRASNEPQRVGNQENSRSGNFASENSFFGQNGFGNGSTLQISVEHEKLLEEVQSLKALQSDHQAELKLLKEKLDHERASTSLLKIKLHEEQQLNKSYNQELCGLKTDMEKMSDSKELRNELDRTLSELRMLQAEVSRGDLEKEHNESLESLKSTIQRLEMENLELNAEKNEFREKLNSFVINKFEKNDSDGSDFKYASKNEQNEVKMASRISQLEEMLKETCEERDKASQELSRLKQHLLDKELEDEDKMDEDCKLIDELKDMTEYQRTQILQLETALLREQTKREELNKLKVDEFHQSNETIKGLKQKLANFMSTIDSKNIELQNLQTALGQYYAESEAKERLERELAVTREESAKYLQLLNAANRNLETSKKESEEINSRLTQTERLLSETRLSLHKCEEDSTRLRHALERSMTTLNRMSLDSDNYVDRRIVIKLLVTYFQRNHSKEVLELMVRMLGFSEEDKQRIGFAQNYVGKGVVRGVLGLPGRLVGGILGGNSAPASSPASSDHQSFADLWVDFLLKETEERERREFLEVAGMNSGEQSSSTTATRPVVPSQGTRGLSGRAHLTANPNSEQVSYSSAAKHLDAEFSTVPLSPANSVSPSPRALSLNRDARLW